MNSNNYKRILSQLFDIKPMKDSVDLDWEKIKKVERIISLRGKTTAKEMQARREALILNHAKKAAFLRENESLVFVKKDQRSEVEEPVNVKRVIASSQLLFDDYFASLKGSQNSYEAKNNYSEDENAVGAEDIEEDLVMDDTSESDDAGEDILGQGKHPTREEILRELEEVEARDRYIENANDEQGEIQEYFEDGPEPVLYSAPPFYIRAGLMSIIVIALSLSLVFPIVSIFDKGGGIKDKSLVASVAIENNEEVKNEDSITENIQLYDEPYNLLYDKFFTFLQDGGNKYLLLFQNNNEVRPTGGLIEFYGVLDINNKDIEFSAGNILDLDSQLNVNIIPPRPLQEASTAWSLHDINWFPDFPISAQKAIWLYEEISKDSVDGVLTFTPQVIIDILELLGPINMPERGLEITSDNFPEVIIELPEENFDHILAESEDTFIDFIFYLLGKIENQDANIKGKVASVLLKNLEEKHILAYFTDPESQNFILKQGWGGKMESVSGDFLSVVNSGLDGYKSDKLINEEILYTAEVDAKGDVIGTVQVNRTYNGSRFQDREDLNYMRVYVPKGSQLLEAGGYSINNYKAPINYENFDTDNLVKKVESGIKIHESGTEIFQESGKTVFGNWVYLEPGTSASVKYKYKLPFRVDLLSSGDNYSLTVQKQSGSMRNRFSGEIIVPEELKIDSPSIINTDLQTDISYKTRIRKLWLKN